MPSRSQKRRTEGFTSSSTGFQCDCEPFPSFDFTFSLNILILSLIEENFALEVVTFEVPTLANISVLSFGNVCFAISFPKGECGGKGERGGKGKREAEGE